jgi:hypothetical protein
MKRKIALAVCVSLALAYQVGFAQEDDSPDSSYGGDRSVVADRADAREKSELRNYIGFTPTFIFMGMYGLVYSRALNETTLLTCIGGYTDFDASPIPFLRNERFRYRNIYGGINLTYFPFSKRTFPRGFYFGFDFVPSIGVSVNRLTKATGSGIGLSGDALVGYSWILGGRFKLSTDVFLNANTPDIHLSGENMNPDRKWSLLPFFDINIGIVF